MSRARDFADLASAYSQDALGSRNLIINGGQQVWQRATATTTTTNSAYNTVDRFSYNKGSSGVYTSTRSTDVPSGQGFSFSNKLDVTTADTSVGAGDAYILKHRIEAQNLARLAYGTSGAKTITLSFWVRSNKTGAYTINLYKHDNTAYNYVREFSISSADTWEKKELTITPTAGSTSLITNSGGAIDIDNGAGLDINFCLSLGSNYTGSTNDSWSSNGNHYGTSNNINWMDSTSNNFYITGIQLECGSTATEFEHESYGDMLRKCQRYYYIHSEGNDEPLGTGVAEAADLISWYIYPPVTMRADPAVVENEGTNYYISYAGTLTDQFDGIKTADRSAKAVYCYADASLNVSGNTAGSGTVVTSHNASSKVALDAEL